MKGTVKFFNDMKGFGFIAAEDGKEYFAHQSALVAGTKIREGDHVTFDVVTGDKGPKAGNIALAGKPAAQAPADDESSDDS